MGIEEKDYIILPKTDLKVSRLSIGTWLFGGLRWGYVDNLESEKTFLAALDLGINFIDTADAYGKGRSEEFVSRLTKGRKEQLVIGTKVGVVWNPDGTRRIDLSKKHLIEAAEGSLQRLKLDKIDLYYLHEPDLITNIEETIEALQLLKAQGKIRYIGLSNFPKETVAQFNSMINVSCLQDELSLIHRDAESANLKFAKENNLGFLAYSPLSKGLLTGKFKFDSQFSSDDNRSGNEDFSGERLKENVEKVDRLSQLAKKLGHSTLAVSIAWVLGLDSVTSVILGARTREQLKEQMKSLEVVFESDTYRQVGQIFS
ncbi:oxidoreductase, aldo/keto reductase family protein [Leptospira weilii str. 2006001853]|uniref:Oxidoreductase, aldo/keto reductase family protein n=2 Tax=Leptospira weilii TaxID=28184 RepID=A0A828Z8F2_9LEPT|nr:aldo/keto reductase [Leptospira weilii]EKR66139.1 oxidoreductase, aldo/keto reductase family protein [Leptospira weilii str. 2006001853]EMM74999.1 oxidoreductase, aldo/keto reductase family protein [Leptospira weilii str. 2006001855]EMN46708.1 oxidoreductase, aldo/keto reductase family protein [Leptospira weilii str. LNT 1234]MCL8265887.1 aldo/keto reductase [Leptospira weilii]